MPKVRLSVERRKSGCARMILHSKRFGIPESQGMEQIDLQTNPAPAIMAQGLNGVGHGQYWIETTLPRNIKPDNKPSYCVPSMAEIAALPWNGFKVVSTFSGAGGSCLGYRMAGFKVVWANEFVPMAQESYKANAAPDCVLDGRDIKHIQPHDILAATGLKVGELDLFDGSPPCQAFSTAGKREKGWGKEKTYEHGATQKNETLFDEYIRLLRGLQPKVFVAENVSGLVKGTAKGMFLQILAAMKASGYRVTCRVLDAQWLGVPQQRQRTIFVGVREDLNREPAHPLPLPYRYSVRDALPWIVAQRQETGGAWKYPTRTDEPSYAVRAQGIGQLIAEAEVLCQSGAFPKHYTPASAPAPAVMAGRTVEMKTATEKRKFTIAELRRICAFPDDFILCGSYAQQWERLGNSVPPVMMQAIATTVRDQILMKIQ